MPAAWTTTPSWASSDDDEEKDPRKSHKTSVAASTSRGNPTKPLIAAQQSTIHKMPQLAFMLPYFGEDRATKGEACLTVTGTPGIGKSVFYAYFFDRYRQENPNTWIFAAAFQEEKVMEFSVAEFKKEPVYYGLDVADDILFREAWMKAAAGKQTPEEDVSDKRLLFLCDGPPDKRRELTVVFTSPHTKWLKFSRKLVSDYYMPLWTLEELQEVAMLLEYPIGYDEIERRFQKFGGVARECLCLTPDILEIAEELLKIAIKKIYDPTKLRNLILEEDMETWPNILHYAPEPDRKFKVKQLAPDFIKEKLEERLLTITSEQMEDLRMEIQDLEEAKICTIGFLGRGNIELYVQ